MNDVFQKFLTQYNGQENVGNTPENIGQCVGLVEVWIDTLKLPHVWGDAKDLFRNADSKSFDKILNTPEGIPLVGDIIIWDGTYNNGPGHTSISTGTGTTKTFEAFEQNDPLGSNCHLKRYMSYQSVLGWLHPKDSVVFTTTKPQVTLDGDKFQELVSKSTLYDAIVAAGYQNADDIIKKTKDLTDENTNLKVGIAQVQKDNSELSQKIADVQTNDSTAIDAGIKAEAGLKNANADLQSLSDALQCPPTLKDLLTAIDMLKTKQTVVVKSNTKTVSGFVSLLKRLGVIR